MSRCSRLALALWLVATCAASTAAAQGTSPAPSGVSRSVRGAADGRVLLGLGGRYGGALSTDLWYGAGLLKIGGAFSAGAISKGSGFSSRVLTPVGLSLALLPSGEDSGPTAVGRGGIAPGARKGGFTVTSWLSCALGYRFALGEGASLRLGTDVWLLLRGGGLFFAPYVGLGF